MPASKLAVFYCRAYQTVFRQALKIIDWTEPTVIKGSGAVKELAKTVKNNGHHSVLVVTDKGLMNLHLLDSLFESLKENGIEYVVYDGTQPNPSISNVEEAARLYRNHCCSGIIAFGGGSPMDCAKGAGAMIARPNTPIKKMKGPLKVLKKLPTLYAVPTTAGTGSETTMAAVISDPSTHEKFVIQDAVVRPKYAVLDPDLTVGLPPHITSTTGIDALTHAVEAHIGTFTTKGTAEASKKATKLIFENLCTAYENGKDIVARENMLEAAYLAGIAFTRAYVGYVHSIAHTLGGLYGIPHGLANSVILPYMLDWYGESVYVPLAELCDYAGLCPANALTEEKAKIFIEQIRVLNSKMNIPEHLEIHESDVSLIAQRALKEGNPGYPVPKIMGFDECVEVIRKIGNLN